MFQENLFQLLIIYKQSHHQQWEIALIIKIKIIKALQIKIKFIGIELMIHKKK